jgi:hypothetical protein
MQINYQDITEDEFMVSEKILVAYTLFNLTTSYRGREPALLQVWMSNRVV